jgi:hypothetical protein
MRRSQGGQADGRGLGVALAVSLILMAWLLMAPAPETGAADPGGQCQACHTDATKLKALTPPDPPSEEEGEG